MLKVRFETLSTRYVQKAIVKNPIITELIEEFKNFSSGGRVLPIKTLLCNMIENNLINDVENEEEHRGVTYDAAINLIYDWGIIKFDHTTYN